MSNDDESEQICKPFPGWFPPPVGLSEIKRVFGDIKLRKTSSGSYTIVEPARWESDNMTIVKVVGYDRPLFVNRSIAPFIVEGFRQCNALNDGYKIVRLGFFNPRFKGTDSGALSLHSWGVAFDLNPDANPMVRVAKGEDRSVLKRDLPDAWIQIFKSLGFVWGGDFKNHYDPMHFQYAKGY